MTAEDFAKRIHQMMVDSYVASQKNQFAKNDISSCKDPYGRSVRALLATLSDGQKTVLYQLVRQTAVDTIASLFSVLDGVSFVEGFEGDWQLLFDGNGIPLNGDLLDLFLEMEEQKDLTHPDKD